jgi:integrase
MVAYGLKGVMPNYKPTRKLPYLSPEAHMDVLIASCSYEMAALLQTLKETAARPVEAMRILWDELDFLQRKIPIKHPAKGCNQRVLDMSEKLSNMLKSLPHKQEKVFIYKNERVAGKTFRVMRQNAITKTGIKELRKITLYTFRYWRATVEFQETGQEVPVMILLGHKSTKYLWLYVQLAKIYFGGTPKYTSVWVNNREEETKLSDAGYTLVRTDPRDGASLYRKQISAAAQLIGHD